MHIKELLGQLPADTKARVESAKSSYNRLIREALRFESRLSLNSGKSDDVSEDNSTRVPIRLDMGHPEAIEGFLIPKKYDFAAILSRIRPALVKLTESSDIVSSFICEHQEIAEISEFVGGGICYAESEAKKLLELVDESLVSQRFRQTVYKILIYR